MSVGINNVRLTSELGTFEFKYNDASIYEGTTLFTLDGEKVFLITNNTKYQIIYLK